jgi:hypothetical protein
MTDAYTTRQMGDAAEHLVIGELTLAGVPTAKMPENWPGYDLVAQRPDGSAPLRISVKSRVFDERTSHRFMYRVGDVFDWLAIVILACPGPKSRRIFLIPRAVADERFIVPPDGSKIFEAGERRALIATFADEFAAYEDNFSLSSAGKAHGAPSVVCPPAI